MKVNESRYNECKPKFFQVAKSLKKKNFEKKYVLTQSIFTSYLIDPVTENNAVYSDLL